MRFEYVILLVVLMALLSLSAVNAMDFDGNFEMDVPKNTSFEKTSSFFGLDIGNTKVYQDFENDINISYISVNDDGKYFNDMIETIEKEPNVNLTKEDDLYLITTERFNIILFNKNHEIIAVSASGLDFDELKEMANSVS
jgi:hypothetical protein